MTTENQAPKLVTIVMKVQYPDLAKVCSTLALCGQVFEEIKVQPGRPDQPMTYKQREWIEDILMDLGVVQDHARMRTFNRMMAEEFAADTWLELTTPNASDVLDMILKWQAAEHRKRAAAARANGG